MVIVLKQICSGKELYYVVDRGNSVLRVLLDLSAAFDKVDHNVFFSRLKDILGLSGKVLDWFQSYMEQRFQTVSVHTILSDVRGLVSDVPESSDLDLLVLNTYTRHFGSVIHR